VDGTQVRVLKEPDEVGLCRLLKCHHGRALKAQIGLEILSNLTDEALEGQLADQQLCGLLVPPDLTEGDGAGAVPVRLLDAAGGGGRLSRGLGGELLPWGLASGRFTGGLLGTSHLGLRRREVDGLKDEILLGNSKSDVTN
jgi:hypothetical protein